MEKPSNFKDIPVYDGGTQTNDGCLLYVPNFSKVKKIDYFYVDDFLKKF